ncbi:MAG: U32 family peptidase [Bacilli bacterium]|nr:U32 family peptidase [Bacilli bacterium]
MDRIELLAPAGSLDRLKIALLYGADAVYFGGRNYSLRANAKNLDISEIKEACDYAHKLNKKVYVTVNIVFHNEDTEGIVDYLKDLSKCGVDAIIVSDPLIVDIVHDNEIKLPIHISTQYSSINYQVVNFWKELGVERVVLGRECSRDEIKEIIDKTGVEIETFVHGAMCASYSGRCVLSNYFTGRDANRGGCAQICRWNFDLEKDNKKVDSSTKFTMASKDLCMLENIPDMIDIGIKSLKVEGRMRSIYYIACVINNYRRAIDEYYQGTLTPERIKYYRHELDKVANRDSVSQFYNRFPDVREQYFLGRDEVSNQEFLGLVEDYDGEYVTVRSKNYFEAGDKVEIISPDRETYKFKLGDIYDSEGNKLDASRHPENLVKFKFKGDVRVNDMLRISLP